VLPGEYARLDAVALRGLIAAGQVTSAEVEHAARLAVAAVDPDLAALARPLFDEALSSDPTGELAGVPFLIKDSGPFARGVGFAIGSRAVRGAVADHDHPLMTRFRAAGLSTIGQTAAPEFALSFATESTLYGATRNPWAPDRGVGGSSGGAAALVAAGAVPLAHANDGAGSIRIPAAACGLVGLKPSRGRTPDAPRSITAGLGTSSEFAVTRTVRDAGLLFSLVAEPAGGITPAPAGLRIAIDTGSWSLGAVDPQVAAATEEVGRMLEWIGHSVTVASPNLDGEQVIHAVMLGVYAAGRAILAAPRQPDAGLLQAVSRAVLAESRAVSAEELSAAERAQSGVTRAVDGLFERFDVLLTPTWAQLPPRHGTLDYDDDRYTARSWLSRLFEVGPFTAPFNVGGHPAISLPLGESAEGLPIGVQLVAAHGHDELLLAVAADLEQAMPWRDRTPVVFAD
jgi:amidase